MHRVAHHTRASQPAYAAAVASDCVLTRITAAKPGADLGALAALGLADALDLTGAGAGAVPVRLEAVAVA